ncbi:MAG: PIN domain-containing protein [Deinococcales bacterium]
MTRIYLDNCTFNRPFDDQNQVRIRLESEAKLYIQTKIQQQAVELVWSYILDFENAKNPFEERRKTVKKWKMLAVIDVEETQEIIAIANELSNKGIKAKDALHIASAIIGKAHYFLTTDDRILKRLSEMAEIQVINPIDLVKVLDGYVN